jgi:hypothetical protein
MKIIAHIICCLLGVGILSAGEQTHLQEAKKFARLIQDKDTLRAGMLRSLQRAFDGLEHRKYPKEALEEVKKEASSLCDEIIDGAELNDLFARECAEVFSEEELRQANAFFDSSAGRKINTKMSRFEPLAVEMGVSIIGKGDVFLDRMKPIRGNYGIK